MGEREASGATVSGDGRLSQLAWIVSGIGLALLLLGMYLAILRRPAGELASEPTWIGEIVFAAAMSVSLIVGGFVASRQPRNVYGWLMMAFGFGIGSIQGVAQNYGIYSYLVAPTPPPLAPLSFFFAGLGLALTLASVSLLFLLFPTGRLPSGRWWLLVVPVILAFVALSAFSWLAPDANLSPAPNPFHGTGPLADLAGTITSTAALILIIAIVISAISVTVRGLRARGIERQQFKWLAFAALSLVVVIFFNTELVPLLPGFLDIFVEALAFAAVPLAIGIAVLRYRLWDIDVIIRKTVQYALVVALLAVLYVGLVVGLQLLFSEVTGTNSTAIVVLSTLAIIALFNPLRRRIQSAVDRRFYRQKYDAEKVLSEFAGTLRDETDLDKLTAELVRVIQQTMQPEFVTMWLIDPPRVPAPELPDSE